MVGTLHFTTNSEMPSVADAATDLFDRHSDILLTCVTFRLDTKPEQCVRNARQRDKYTITDVLTFFDASYDSCGDVTCGSSRKSHKLRVATTPVHALKGREYIGNA